jgi:hypothetical protein
LCPQEGKSFQIHNPAVFSHTILPKYFHHDNISSFKRQLNLYDFSRGTNYALAGSFAHPLFARGNQAALSRIKRLSRKVDQDSAARPHALGVDMAVAAAVVVELKRSDNGEDHGVNEDNSRAAKRSREANKDKALFDSPVQVCANAVEFPLSRIFCPPPPLSYVPSLKFACLGVCGPAPPITGAPPSVGHGRQRQRRSTI